MRRSTIVSASILALLSASSVGAQSYTIEGKTYVPTLPAENVAVTFTVADGEITPLSYSGFVRLVVSGSGVSCTPARNDAFYIYQWQSGCSSPNIVPQHDPNFYQLTFDTKPLVPSATSRIATRFIYYDIDAGKEVLSRPYVPAYRADHTYSFIVNTGLVSPAPLHFGVSDGGFGDNSGGYVIQVTQLTEVASSIQIQSVGPNTAPPFAPGTNVTFTVSATGGVPPLQYEMWLYRAGTGWTLLRDYSPANQVTWTPPVEGTYLLQVWVRSAGSIATYDAWANYGPFEVKVLPLQVRSLTANVRFPVVAGTPVTWTAATSGGTGPYTFQFWVFNGSKWTLGRDWSDASTWTWEPPLPGAYLIQVWARNAGSANQYDAWQSAVATIQTPAVLTVTSVTPSASSVPAGTPVTWTATATGGTPPYMFKFFVFDGAGWTEESAWHESNTWKWVPPAAGTYLFQVWARQAGSSAALDAWRSFGPYTATRPSALTVTALNPDPPVPAAAGTPVTWTATVAGGSGPYTYKFYVYNGTTWSLGQDWSLSRRWTWVPPSPGSYTVQVWVRNSGSGTAFDAWLAAPFAAGPAVTLSVSPPSSDRIFPIAAGTPVKWTAQATGGTGPYTYKFYVFDGSTWTIGQDWGAANTWTWIPPAAGTYYIQVWVRNAGSASLYDTWAWLAAPVSAATSLSVPTIAVSPMSPLVAGAPAVVTATASGGLGPYAYQFYVYDGSTWSIGQSWSEASTFNWVPSAPGTYFIQVWVRNAGSAAVYDQWGMRGPVVIVP